MNDDKILRDGGYSWNEDRQMWFSHAARKAFSVRVLNDNTSNWLRERLAEDVPAGEFWFYQNFAPDSLETYREILGDLRLSDLEPVIKAAVSTLA